MSEAASAAMHARFNPNHAPAGSSNGGQFTSGGGSGGGKSKPSASSATSKAAAAATASAASIVDQPGVGEEVRLMESTIMDKPTEVAFAWAPDGHGGWRTVVNGASQGKRSRVEFTDAQLRQLDNGVMTHNHPSGSSFSRQDIVTAATHNLAEVRVVTPSGTTYSMGRPATGWPKPEDISTDVTLHMQTLSADAWKSFHGTTLAQVQHETKAFNQGLMHQTWSDLAPEFGMRYTRTDHAYLPDTDAEPPKHGKKVA